MLWKFFNECENVWLGFNGLSKVNGGVLVGGSLVKMVNSRYRLGAYAPHRDQNSVVL